VEEATAEGARAQPAPAADTEAAPSKPSAAAAKPDDPSSSQAAAGSEANEPEPASTQAAEATKVASGTPAATAAEAPKAAEPEEEPKASEPKAAEPKAAEPKAAEPKAAETKAAEPKAAEPKAAEPKAAEAAAADKPKPTQKKPMPKRPAPPKAPPPAHLLAAAREAQKKAAEEEAGVGAFDGQWVKEGSSTYFTVQGKDCYWPNGEKYTLIPLSRNECILHMKDKAFYGNLTPDGRCVWDNGSAWQWKGEVPEWGNGATWETNKKHKAADDGKSNAENPRKEAEKAPLKAPGSSASATGATANAGGRAPAAGGNDDQDFPDKPKRWSLWGSKTPVQAAPTKKTAAEQTTAPPTVSVTVEALRGMWVKEGTTSRYRIEGTNVHWLDSGVVYKLHMQSPGRFAINIEGVVYNAQAVQGQAYGFVSLKWNNGAVWVREETGKPATVPPPGTGKPATVPPQTAAPASGTSPGPAQAPPRTIPPPPAAPAAPGPGQAAGVGPSPHSAHSAQAAAAQNTQAATQAAVAQHLHALNAALAREQYRQAAVAQQQALAAQQVIAAQQSAAAQQNLASQQAAQAAAAAQQNAALAQQQAASSAQRETDKIAAAAAAHQMASANALLNAREATRGLAAPMKGAGDRMLEAARAALSSTSAPATASTAPGSTDTPRNSTNIKSASAKALEKLKKEDAKKEDAKKRKGRGRSSTSSRRSRSRRRGGHNKDKDRGRHHKSRSRDRRRSPKDKHRRHSGRKSRSRSRSASRRRHRSPEKAATSAKLSAGGASASSKGLLRSKAAEEAAAQLFERFRLLDLALDGNGAYEAAVAQVAKNPAREDHAFDWQEFSKVKGCWVDDLNQAEPEDPEPPPEEEGAWGEEAPEPEKGLDPDMEGELEQELDLNVPEAAPRAMPSTAPRATVPLPAASDDWDADEWEDVDLDAPPAQSHPVGPSRGPGFSADDDTEEEDIPEVRGAWVTSASHDSELPPPAEAEDSQSAFDARPRHGSPPLAVIDEEACYDRRINQAGVVEENQVAVRQDPRCVRVVSQKGPVNLGAACMFCSGFGEVVAMRLEDGSDGQEAVIEFRTDESAQACLDRREHAHFLILPRSIDDNLI